MLGAGSSIAWRLIIPTFYSILLCLPVHGYLQVCKLLFDHETKVAMLGSMVLSVPRRLDTMTSRN